MFDMFVTGFSAIASFQTLLMIIIGVILGIIFGASPGITTSMGITFVLPVTFGMSAIPSMALLIGLYIGGVSGGLITAILINIPGTPASIATTFDGHPMAQRGEAGKALGIGILYSFLGGVFSLIVLIAVAPALARVALKFGPVEYFAIGVFSLTLISSLSGDSLVRGMISAVLGIMLATVGASPIDGIPRFTLGIHELDGGLDLLPALIGIYAITEILHVARSETVHFPKIGEYKMKGFGISFKEFRQQFRNFIRSSVIGTVIGILPGLGAGIANIIAYSAEKNSSKYPEKFGTGIIDGIVASETSNNAVSGGALVPLLTMGIPGDAGTAVLLAALMIQGVTPGPLMFRNNADIIYAIFASLIVANVAMIVIEYFGLRIFLKLLNIPKFILFPLVIMLCVIGAFGLNNRVFDVRMILFFGIVGYLLDTFDYPSAPLILGIILGPLIEINFRRGLMSTYGDFGAFFLRPVAAAFLVITVLIVLYKGLHAFKKRRSTAE